MKKLLIGAAVGALRGVAGGDGAVTGDCRPQVAQGLGGGAGTHSFVRLHVDRVALAPAPLPRHAPVVAPTPLPPAAPLWVWLLSLTLPSSSRL